MLRLGTVLWATVKNKTTGGRRWWVLGWENPEEILSSLIPFHQWMPGVLARSALIVQALVYAKPCPFETERITSFRWPCFTTSCGHFLQVSLGGGQDEEAADVVDTLPGVSWRTIIAVQSPSCETTVRRATVWSCWQFLRLYSMTLFYFLLANGAGIQNPWFTRWYLFGKVKALLFICLLVTKSVSFRYLAFVFLPCSVFSAP